MASYGFLAAISDLIGLASTVAVVVWLVTGLQPGFERARDSCRAGKPPHGRAQLLWFLSLVPVLWQAAAALYLRHLFSLWDVMRSWLDSEPVNRLVYAFLHLYLYFLLLCGIYACTVTVVEISRNREVLGDVLMIARFGTNGYELVEDIEAQRGSPAPPPHDEGLRSNGQRFSKNVARTTARTKDSEHSAQESTLPASDRHISRFKTWAVQHTLCNSPYSLAPTGSVEPSNPRRKDFDNHDAHTVRSTSGISSGTDEPHSDDDDSDRQILPLAKLREYLEAKYESPTNGTPSTDQRACLKGADDDNDADALYDATPRLGPRRPNDKVKLQPLDTAEPQSPCDSCSSAHARTIPTAKRSPVRVPITPTSPTADAEDADTEKTDVGRKKKRERKCRGGAAVPPHLQIRQALLAELGAATGERAHKAGTPPPTPPHNTPGSASPALNFSSSSRSSSSSSEADDDDDNNNNNDIDDETPSSSSSSASSSSTDDEDENEDEQQQQQVRSLLENIARNTMAVALAKRRTISTPRSSS